MANAPDPTGEHGRRRVVPALSPLLFGADGDGTSAGVVYGLIAVGILLAAEGTKGEDYLRTIEAIAFTLVLYWVAHTYARVTGTRIEGGAPLTVGELARASAHELAILQGALLPLLAVVVAWLCGASMNAGIQAGLWTAAAGLVALELVAGLRAGLGRWALVAQMSFGVLIGAAIVVLRLVVH
jgi:hypothetical protein